jgi:arylsulfatase A-like enzyme
MFKIILIFYVLLPCSLLSQDKPNVIIIYTDDIGYGDLSCYGAKKVITKQTDKLAKEGLRFTQAHSPAATCTPSRYAVLTGEYSWRRKGTGVAPGDAPMIITPERYTLADMFKSGGYATGVIGKWHLGLGAKGQQDWNGLMTPGLRDLGFDYSYIMAATGDRVPCVLMENDRVEGLDPSDPIEVSYKKPFDGLPTGKNNPELLRVHPSHGHDQAIIDGISRIGYMRGGNKALWVDEDIADSITVKAVKFIEKNHTKPFFLLFATNDIHVPRAPHPRFVGQTSMGPRGDAIVQMDWCVGKIVETLERLSLKNNTIIIFTSDNGPVVDDGYRDDSVEKLGDHKPAGNLRGGKYSKFEAGTRVPFIISYPNKIKKGVSNALVSQIDLMHTLASIIKVALPEDSAPDSFNSWDTWAGENKKGREYIIEATNSASLSIRTPDWKYIETGSNYRYDTHTNIELGNDTIPQLFHLKKDISEKSNLAFKNSKKLAEMQALLKTIKSSSKTR